MAVAGSLKFALEVFETPSEPVQGGGIRHILDLAFALASGTSDGQINMIYSHRDSVAASATDQHDLAGSKAGALGNTLTFVDVTTIILVNRSTTAGDVLHLSPPAANGFLGPFADASDIIKVGPGVTGQPAFVILHEPRGWAVTAGTGDLLDVIEAGGANTVSYDLYVLGRSA